MERLYPRYPVIIGLLTAILLLSVGIGAIMVLGITPLAGRPPSAFFEALNIDRVVYALKSATLQASLSSLLSLLLAIPISLAISRRAHWRGIRTLTLLFSLAMVLPTTVAAMGLLAVWGRQGLVASACGGICDFSPYGLHGVILAHLMLNVPLAVRAFVPLLDAIPEVAWRLSAHLDMRATARFRHVEWPAIRNAVPGLASLIFLLCFTSFALVLMLGGGPKVTTLEVEIYSAIRFDFDIVQAAGLSLIQFVLAALVVGVAALSGHQLNLASGASRQHRPMRADLSRFDRLADIMMLAGASILIGLPVVMVAIQGLNSGLGKLVMRPQFIDGLVASIIVSTLTALIVSLLSVLMASAKAGLSLPHRFGSMRGATFLRAVMDQGIMLYLVIPSVVLGTAAFIFLRASGDVFGYAFIVVILANSLMALPFAYRLLEPRMTQIYASHDRIAAHLGIAGISRMKVLSLPALAPDIGLIAGLSAALSFGDFGVIALFANADFRTLPWLLYQLSGNYAADEAKALAMILMLLTVVMFATARYLCSTLPRIFSTERAHASA